MQVPFFRTTFDPAALAGIEECLRSGWLTTGPKTRQFEHAFGEFVGGDQSVHAVALNSCTAALHLALEAIGLQRGEIVIVPTMTFAATAEVVRYFDATPVFVDTEADTLNLSVSHLRATLEMLQENQPLPGIAPPYGRVRAVIPVHYGGQPCDLAGVHEVAREFGIDVIEDAAHAFPAGWLGADGTHRMIGSGTSRVTCFSFYANKTITTGEGGMAVTADARLADRMRLMSLHGMSKDAWKRFEASGTWDYQLVAPGFKYNLTDIASALGLAQLVRAEEYRCLRERICDAYDHGLSGIDVITLPVRRSGLLHAHHLYVIQLDLDALRVDRAEFIHQLKQMGVMCSVHWRPLHMHPYYVATYGYAEADYPIAACVWSTIVSLPLFPSMTEIEVAHVIEAIRATVHTFKR